ncbi:MAG TPA: 4Fe-4S dicluster domain-containing protein [Armatimonadota bacterium]|nr:4Fe-4S dicluster domain-containing protein [Armatimonadota bacterium]
MAKATAEDRLTISDDRTFSDEIGRLSGQNITACYQCGECTGGCPVAYAADLMPNQVMRLIQLGQDESVLKSSMIWLCVGCETCTTRCPRGIELAAVMDALRETSVRLGIAAGEPAIRKFHETFLNSVERGGRVHEVSMLAEYKLRSLNLFSDLFLGAKMFLKGKLALIPKFIKNRREIKRIFGEARRK